MNILIKYNRWILVLAFLAVFAFAAAVPKQAVARPQEAIVLLYFQGTGQDNAVLLEWATATEFETAGFVVDRADNEAGPYTEQIGFIPGEGNGIIGAEYEVIDDVNVVNGQTYWYILVEIENNGTRNETDPISVTAGEPTPTPTRTPTTQATTSSQATSTPTPSRTPTPTATSQAGSSATPTPTITASASQTTQTGSSSQQTATAAADSNTTNGNTGSTGIAEASAPNTSPYPGPEQTPSPTFVPDPGQATESESEPYPGPTGEGFVEEGYPAGTAAGTEGDSGASADLQPQSSGDTRVLGTQPPLNQQNPAESQQAEPGSSNTLFLWIGFAAAFLIFVGGVVGSIFLFTRRSNQK